jgi:hypothetical protein
LARITQKQIEAKRILQTSYIPLNLAFAMDEVCARLGISRSTLINRCIVAGLKDEEKMLSEGDNGLPTFSPRTANSNATPATTHHEGTKPKEVVEAT